MILSRGHKLRYANQFVGAFVLLVLGLLFTALLIVAWGQEWFVPNHEIYAYVPEGELDGLQVNTPLQILGERVGKVREISYVDDVEMVQQLLGRWPTSDTSGRHFLRVTLQISDRFINEVDVGSKIHIRRRLAGVGDVYLEILRGDVRLGRPDASTIFVIYSEKSAQDELRTMTRLMAEVQRDFMVMRESLVTSSAAFERSNEKIAQTSGRIQDLADSLLEVTPRLPEIADEVRRTTVDMRATSERFRETTEEIGQSNRQLQNVLTDAEAASPRLLPIAKQTEQLLATSQVVADRLKDESEDLPGTVNEFRGAVGDAQEVIDGLRQNWLIRRHVEQPRSPDRLPSSKVRVGGISR